MAMKKHKIPFRVFWDREKKEDVLKLAKPNVSVQSKSCPNVSRRNINSENTYALRIMHSLNHKNIVSMKAVGRSKVQEGNEISAFIEQCAGRLTDQNWWSLVADNSNMIPSVAFQNIIREIFDGADFLWRSMLYHGNLSWNSILWDGRRTVKLYDFRKKELSVVLAQWEDWVDIIAMLQVVADEAGRLNGHNQNATLFFDEINSLIDTMNTLPRDNILSMRERAFENVLFWTPSKRTKFVMITIGKLLFDAKFIEEVKNSTICSSNWDQEEARLWQPINLSFKAVLKHCNDYRARLKPPVNRFNTTDKMECVKFVCASYTHWSEIGQNVDFILRAKFPKLFVELYRIVKTLAILV